MMQYDLIEGGQGICPLGWHIPSDAEWCTMTKYLDPTVDCQVEWDFTGTNAGSKLKETGTAHWASPNSGATNTSGFTGLGAGYWSGGFSISKHHFYCWTSSKYTEYSENEAWIWGLHTDYPTVEKLSQYKLRGFSVRCLKYFSGVTKANAGPDQLNLPDTTTTLQANYPSLGYGTWSIVSGTGGVLENYQSPVSKFHGIYGNSYTLRWTVTNGYDSDYDDVVISFANCPPTFTDSRDGKSYTAILISTQCWMKKNLNFGMKVDGTVNMSNNETIEKYCYDNTEANCDVYGGLYQWNEMMQYSTTEGVQGICPAGWHLPSDAEISTLETYLGGLSVAGGKLKEAGTSHWQEPNTDATNSSDFTALPGGYRDLEGGFVQLHWDGHLWSSTEDGSSAWKRKLYFDDGISYRYGDPKEYGFSVRCIKDELE
jgi:uncharacterized protein (TIGR02145 family)